VRRPADHLPVKERSAHKQVIPDAAQVGASSCVCVRACVGARKRLCVFVCVGDRLSR
jgi:hypothetical protein